MERKIKNKNNVIKYLNNAKKDRNYYLLIIFYYLIYFTILFLYLKFSLDLDIDKLSLIFSFVVIFYLFILFLLIPKILLCSIKYNYYQMIIDNNYIINLNKKIYTNSWLKFIQDDQFLEKKYNDYIIYYKLTNKLDNTLNRGYVFIAVIVSLKYDLDFYSEEISKHLEELRLSFKKGKRANKDLIIQFQKFDKFYIDILDTLDKIICYKSFSNYIININVGFFVNNNSIYYLRPKKRYPNRYYYYLVNYINKLCYLT